MKAKLVAIVLSIAASVRGAAQEGGGAEIYSLTGKNRNCDFLGSSLAALGDIDGDGAADFAVGAEQDFVDPEAKGYVWLVSGRLGEVIRELRGEAIGNRFGSSIGAFQDLDDDGLMDLGVGGGKDITIFSSGTGQVLKKITVVGPEEGATSLHFINPGDVDGDGTEDLLTGRPGARINSISAAGKAAVFSGKEGRLRWEIRGNQYGANLGVSLATVGDVDGDNLPDVAVGESYGYFPEDDFDENEPTGTVYLLRGIDGREIRRLGEDLKIHHFGTAMVNPGDLDGDGYPELVVGAPGYFERGRRNLGWVGVYSTRTWQLLHRYVGIDIPQGLFFGDALGIAVGAAGDADGDRVPDFLVGARHFGTIGVGPADWGRVELRSGRTFGVLSVFEGSQSGQAFVSTLGPLGDIDGDGRSEFLIGSTFSKICSGQVFVAGHRPELPAFLRGDANRDGVVDLSDAVALIGILYFGEPPGPCLAALDVDGSNRVDVVDAAWIIFYLFDAEYAPAPPFPDCGRYGGFRKLGPGCAGSTCSP